MRSWLLVAALVVECCVKFQKFSLSMTGTVLFWSRIASSQTREDDHELDCAVRETALLMAQKNVPWIGADDEAILTSSLALKECDVPKRGANIQGQTTRDSISIATPRPNEIQVHNVCLS